MGVKIGKPHMSFQTTLIDRVCRDGGPLLEFEKDVVLPVPPAPWYSIGLEPHSEFNIDELVVTRAMYLPVADSWLAELELSRFGAEWDIWGFIHDELRPGGWRLRLKFPLESIDEGVQINLSNETDEGIIECRGKFWMVDSDEVRALEEFGEPFVTHVPSGLHAG